MTIVLKECDCKMDDKGEIKTYVDILGSYTLEFLEWKKCLGMELETEALFNFTKLEIIAY